MSVIQQEGELVSSYIKRFHDESLTTTDISVSATVPKLINGLRTHNLKWQLIKNGVTFYVEAMQIAQRFVQTSDICTPVDSRSKKNKNDKLQSQSQPHANPYRKEYTGYSRIGSGRQEPPRFDHNYSVEWSKELKDGGYDPRFNRKRKDIFYTIRSELPQPSQVSTSMNRRNMYLWCEYHKEHGHTLAHCRELKKVLDQLANEGKFGRFMNHNQ